MKGLWKFFLSTLLCKQTNTRLFFADGRLQFKPTSAGLIQKHPQPVFAVQETDHDDNNSAVVVEQQTTTTILTSASSPSLLSSSSSPITVTNQQQQQQQHDNTCANQSLRNLQMNSLSSNLNGISTLPPG